MSKMYYISSIKASKYDKITDKTDDGETFLSNSFMKVAHFIVCSFSRYEHVVDKKCN